MTIRSLTCRWVFLSPEQLFPAEKTGDVLKKGDRVMKRIWLLLPLLMLFTPHFVQADSITLTDFEGLVDGTSVGSLIPGLVFTNATVLTAGISLNDFDFPPHSGKNVIFDDGAPISINFTHAVGSVGGFFTYAGGPVKLEAFDATHTLVGTVTSAFSTNFVSSGVGSPNEFLSVASADGISSVTITGTGSPFGGTFTLDDLSFTAATPVPAPSSLGLLAIGIALLFVRRHRTTST